MNEQIDGLEKNITHISQELKSLSDLIGTGFTKVDTNFNSIKNEINTLNTKIDLLTKKVDLLKGSTNEGFEDVGLKLENLTEEITKIGMEVVKIKDIDLQKEISHYYLTTTISGIVYELGSKNDTISPHIYIDGEDYKIYISKEDDLLLKPYYKTNSLNLRLRQKISIKDNHIISASLLSFEPKNKSLIESLNELDTTDFDCLKGIEITNDILTKYYG